MDDTDRTLIRLLRDDARLSLSALAAAAGVSRGTVQNRLARLQKDGIILGYTLRLREEAGGAVRAVMLAAVTGTRLTAVVRALRGLPEVASVHTTNGRWDLVVSLAAPSLERFDDALRRIRLIEGVNATETSLLLSDRP